MTTLASTHHKMILVVGEYNYSCAVQTASLELSGLGRLKIKNPVRPARNELSKMLSLVLWIIAGSLKASNVMKMEMVNPMPPKKPVPIKCFHDTSFGNWEKPVFTAKKVGKSSLGQSPLSQIQTPYARSPGNPFQTGISNHDCNEGTKNQNNLRRPLAVKKFGKELGQFLIHLFQNRSFFPSLKILLSSSVSVPQNQ